MQMGTAALHLRAAPGQEGEKSALWRFLVLNFKREKKKNISKNSLYNPRH